MHTYFRSAFVSYVTSFASVETLEQPSPVLGRGFSLSLEKRTYGVIAPSLMAGCFYFNRNRA